MTNFELPKIPEEVWQHFAYVNMNAALDALYFLPPREWPWERPATAMIKEGPKSLMLIS